MSMPARMEKLALGIMAAGIAMVWQPWVGELFRWGFAVILAGVAGFILASHLPRKSDHE